MNDEERLIRLEEQAYFIDEKLKDIEGRLLAQQLRMESLARQTEATIAALARIRDYLDEKGRKIEEKPPHYQNDPW